MLPEPVTTTQMPIRWSRFTLYFALFIGLLGFLPHALFSYEVGSWHYMANAWDEDSYAKYALIHRDVIYRLIGATILRQWEAWFGLDVTMTLFDVIPPMLCAVLASALSYTAGFRSGRGLFLASCLIVFAIELLGLANVSMTGSLVGRLLPFSSFSYPEWARMLMPNLFANYFNLYKSPEPQITFVIQLTALWLMLRHAQTLKRRYGWQLLWLSLSFPFIYVSTGIALFIAMGIYAGLGVLVTRKAGYGWFLGGVILSAIYYLAVVVFLSPPSESAAVFLFHSRLPAISPSLLWATLALWLSYRRWGQQWRGKAEHKTLEGTCFFVLACCAVPFITLNQQVITGVMVQSRTWDNYTNLPFMALVLLLLWPELKQWAQGWLPSRILGQQWLARYAVALLAAWLVLAQYRMVVSFRPASLNNLAAARLLTDLRTSSPAGLPALMLENVGDDSQVALRMGPPFVESIAGYQQTIKHFVSPLSEGEEAYAESIAEIKEQAFAYFDRKGLTPEALERAMLEDANRLMAGPHIIYFFALIDSWWPLSDHRRDNGPGLREKIPALIADYRSFLASKKRRLQFGEILYVTEKKREPRAGVPWRETLAGEMTLGKTKPVTVYVYRQTPR